jgi:cytoskeleton protein RodZ
MEIGQQLRAARERTGLALGDIARRTNIPLPVLEAIERGDVGRVPGGCFVRAHLRAFASQVGIDPEQVVAAFLAEHGPRPPEDELIDLRRRCSTRAADGSRWAQAVALVIAAALLVGVGLLVARPASAPTTAPGAGPSAVDSRPEPGA